MHPDRSLPTDMGDICRLCLSSEDGSLPIFGEDDVEDTNIPLSFRILACVSVEVSLSDGLPSLICRQCLHQVNTWHEFKQLCDSSQATLKEWQNSTRPAASEHVLDKSINIKQEPIDVEEDEDDMMEILDDSDDRGHCDELRDVSMFVDIKQEEIEVSDREDSGVEHLLEDHSNSLDLYTTARVEIKSEDPCSEVEAGSNLNTEENSGEQRPLRRSRRSVFSRPKRYRSNFETDKPYNCRICQKAFGSKAHVARHEKIHGFTQALIGSPGSHVCTVCSKAYSSKSNLERHFRLHTGRKSLACVRCMKQFPDRSSFFQHRSGSDGTSCYSAQSETKLHSAPLSPEPNQQMGQDLSQEYRCYICREAFFSQYRLKMHMSSHSSFKCHKCTKSFGNGTALSNHLRSHNLRSVRRHTCRFCLRSFLTLTAMISHRKSHFKTGAKIEESSEPTQELQVSHSRNSGAQCTVCNKWLNSFSMLERHMITHTQHKPYTCSICNIQMGYASSVHKHMRLVHGITVDYHTIKAQLLNPIAASSSENQANKPVNNFNCNKCNKTFQYKSLLLRHNRAAHAITQNHECNMCSRVFSHRYLLERHSKTHIGQTVFNCGVCFKAFRDQRTLNHHKGVHKRFKLYSCNICGKSFNGLRSWQEHQLMHTSGVTLTCGLCDKEFSTRAELTEHKRMHIKLKIYTCTICKNSYNSSSALSKHKRKHVMGLLPVDEKPHICDICGKAFADDHTLGRHKMLHAKRASTATPVMSTTQASAFPCNQCSRTFRDQIGLQRHRGWHTRRPGYVATSPIQSPTQQQSPRVYTCEYCNKCYNNAGSLGKHKKYNCSRIVESGQESFEEELQVKPETLQPLVVLDEKEGANLHCCHLCSKVFHTAKALVVHRGWHARGPKSPTQDIMQPIVMQSPVLEEEKPYVTFAETTDTEDESKYYKCDVCKKNFSCTSSLRKHKRQLHSQKSPPGENSEEVNGEGEGYACEVCQRVFKKEMYLMQHVVVHTGVKEYNCNECPRTFGRHSMLMKHKKANHKPKPHSCLHCPLKFFREVELKRHLVLLHNEEGEDSEKLTEDSEKLTEDSEKLTEDSEKLTEDSEKLTEDSEKLTEDSEKLTEDSEKLTENSEKLTENSDGLATINVTEDELESPEKSTLISNDGDAIENGDPEEQGVIETDKLTNGNSSLAMEQSFVAEAEIQQEVEENNLADGIESSDDGQQALGDAKETDIDKKELKLENAVNVAKVDQLQCEMTVE